MLKPVFTLTLDAEILPRRVAVGKFDGTHPCLVAATTADKVLIHNPHGRALNPQMDASATISKSYAAGNTAASDVEYLNINQAINALACGPLHSTGPRHGHETGSEAMAEGDALVIGTPTSLLVYDVQNNRDFFYRDIPDGTNAVAVGHVAHYADALAVSGGNCALQGFSRSGADVYWTVTGDNITALALGDLDGDGQNEVLVGSEDHDIRLFKGDSILYELSETDSVASLCPLGPETFAYALDNGTLGVYHRRERLWRIKSKNRAICIAALDINGDGIPEVLTGWSNGKVDGRIAESGEVIFKDSFKEPIAAILFADYNCDGQGELIVVTNKGNVKGYIPAGVNARPGQGPSPLGLPHGVQPVLAREAEAAAELELLEQDAIREMMKRKTNLTSELHNYEENNRVVSGAGAEFRGAATAEEDSYGAIPADTQLRSALVINAPLGESSETDSAASIILSLETNNDTIIRAAVIFAEGIFEHGRESCVYHPASEAEVLKTVSIPLRPERDAAVDLHIKALVGYRGSVHFHVFELTRHLPKFSMYANATASASHLPQESSTADESGFVKFQLLGHVQSVVSWFTNHFLLVRDMAGMIALGRLDMHFVSLRDGARLRIEWDIGGNGEFIMRTASMELAGDLIQSLAVDTLRLENLAAEAHFPAELDRLKGYVTKVEDLGSVRDALAADIADNSGLIRALVIRAEDARLLKEYEKMRSLYLELHQLNTELLNEYQIRSRNHGDLVDALKSVNVTIQRAGNLRVGESKTKLIQAARNAIKANNLNALTRIITSGEF